MDVHRNEAFISVNHGHNTRFALMIFLIFYIVSEHNFVRKLVKLCKNGKNILVVIDLSITDHLAKALKLCSPGFY